MKRISSILALSLLSCAAVAEQNPATPVIFKSEGFGGYLNVGVGYIGMKSNMIAELNGNEMSDDRIDDLGGASREEIATPTFAGQLTYTMPSLKTQFFFGTAPADYLRFERQLKLGVHQKFDGIGVATLAGVYKTPVIKTYKNPYETDVKRSTTNMSGSGIEFRLLDIADTNVYVRAQMLKVEIDSEKSTNIDRELDREGDYRMFELGYTFKMGGNHNFVPYVRYLDYDLDGDAMARDGYSVNAIYTRPINDRWGFALNGGMQWLKSDDVNPLFDDKYESTRYHVNATLSMKEPFGLDDWRMLFLASIGEEENDISFYSEDAVFAGITMLRHF